MSFPHKLLEKTTKLPIQPVQLSDIVKQVFDTMFEFKLSSMETVGEQLEGFPNWLHATIGIAGEQDSKVHIIAPISLAQRIACSMFLVNTHELSDDEMLDAFGEVANVVGGSIASTVGQGCKLSLPSVAVTTEPLCFADGATLMNCDGIPILFSVMPS